MTEKRRRGRRIVFWTFVVIAVLLLVIQLVPYGRIPPSAPVQKEPEWDSPQTRALAVRACFDCHSNETRWPWYARVAPVSWLVRLDVEEGRRDLNFSEWHREQEEASEAARTIYDGSMPPARYLLLHPSARLTTEEKRLLAEGLSATMSTTTHGEQLAGHAAADSDSASTYCGMICCRAKPVMSL